MRTATTASRAAGRVCACTSDYSRLVRLTHRASAARPLSGRAFSFPPLIYWRLSVFETSPTYEVFVFHQSPMLKIALPNKGRLADDTRELFGDAGLPVLTKGDRALSASLGGEFEALFVRAQDIPEFVADGVADVGVTGWDLVRESGRPVEGLLDLGFGECRLIAAARDDGAVQTIDDIAADTRIAT